MTVAKSNTRLPPFRNKGLRVTDGFKPEDFRDARTKHGLTLRDAEDLSGIPRATINSIERGACRNPVGRQRLIDAYVMKHPTQPGPVITLPPAPVSAPVSGAYDELLDFIATHTTDELVLARLKYEKLLAARTKG